MTLERPETYRQSLIATFDSCPRRALFALQDELRTPSPFAAVGTLFHRWAQAAIGLMRTNREKSIAVEMGMELLLDVLAQRNIPADEVVPIQMKDMRWLRVLAVKFCLSLEITVSRIVDVERRLYAQLPLPSGETVTVTGQLDVLMADPPDGAVVMDFKSGWARPKNTRSSTSDEEGRGLTELGWVQSVIYAFLIFENFASVERVIFREWHVRWGEARQTVIYRWQSERMRDVLAAQVALLDAAVREGEHSRRWTESPGTHCSLCSRPRDCPIRTQVGIPTNEAEARQLAQEWIVAGAVRSERLPYLKGWCAERGPVEVPHSKGRRFVGWSDDKHTFGVYEPKPDESPYDAILEQALGELAT